MWMPFIPDGFPPFHFALLAPMSEFIARRSFGIGTIIAISFW